MAISKEQPMRPAEIEMLDAVNTAQDDITALKEANTTLSETLEETNRVIGQLHQEIGQEIETRGQADGLLTDAINQETETRSQADGVLTDAINEVKADIAAIPVFEYGTSEQTTVGSASSTMVTIQFAEPKTSTPYILFSLSGNLNTLDCYGAVTAASNSAFTVTLHNAGIAEATVEVVWLAIGE